MVPLNRGWFYGVYYSAVPTNGQNNLMQQIKNQQIPLLIRLPGARTLYNDVSQEIMDLIQPFVLVSVRWARASWTTKLSLLAHIDKFFMTFDDDFDCTGIVKASGLEDGTNTLNQSLQMMCQENNAGLVSDLKLLGQNVKMVFVNPIELKLEKILEQQTYFRQKYVAILKK